MTGPLQKRLEVSPDVIYFLQNLCLDSCVSQEYLVEPRYLTRYATSVRSTATLDKVR